MWFHCARCGFERIYPAQPAPTCPVCGIGTLQQGLATSGFGLDNSNDIVVRNIAQPPYQPVQVGKFSYAEKFNYFADTAGAYLPFIRQYTTYVGKFTNILVPDDERFAWLTPYTGNKHNRTHFTQMVLATVARAKFVSNGGRFPRLIEPFVGSGQIFLHACQWGPALNQGVPLFHEVVAGDLNPYVIAAYEFIQVYGDTLVNDYLLSARSLDERDTFDNVANLLNTQGARRLANQHNPGERHEAAMMYIWLVNRCLRGSKLNDRGGVTATVNNALNRGTVRKREGDTLAAVLAALRTIRFQAACRDFAATCAVAQPGDIVFMDCPFPKFSNKVPTKELDRPETFGSETANTYGTGDDGAGLQTRIVQEAARLTAQGTTVILCNFANPGLVLAYRKLLTGIGEGDKRHYVYTYRSPTTESEAYQLTILPGHNVDFTAVPGRIRARWNYAGGDDGYDVNNQEFFDRGD